MDKKKQIDVLQNELKTDSQIIKFIADLFTEYKFKFLHTYPDQLETDGIVLYRQDTLEGEPLWTCCLIRAGNIGGSSGTDIRNRTPQIIERTGYLLNKEFLIDEHTKIKTDRILIICNGNISKNSQIKIKERYNDAVIVFWDVDKLSEITAEKWPGFFETKEPLLKEYCSALKSSLEDISKELQVLYYNKKVKKLWDIFINLQLVETRIVTGTSTITSLTQLNEKTRKDGYSEETVVPIKRLLKQKFKIEEILETGKDSIIIGDFGSGKTTILKRIAFEILDSEKGCDGFKFPIFLLARNFENFEFDLLKYATFEVSRLIQGKNFEFVEYLGVGRIVLLIDGLDDIIDGNKDKFIESVSIFRDKYPKVQIILATRPIMFLEKEKLFENFRKFEIQPLDFNQISELINKWYPTERSQKNKLLNVLKKTALIVSIPKTPLAITLLSIIFEDEEKVDEIPANVTELYNKFTEVFSGKWDRDKGVSSQDKYGIRSHLTNQVAFYMHFNRRTELLDNELDKFVNDYKQMKRYDEVNTRDLIDDFLNRNPLILYQNDRYRFLHLSFQEYFASKGALQTNEYITDHHSFFVTNYLDPWWSNVILFYVGSIKDCPQFLIDATEKSRPETLDQKYLKIDNTGKIIQAAISTDNEPKVKALSRILKTIDYFRDALINELKNDEHMNLFFRRNGLSELYIIMFIKNLFITTYKSKYLRPVISDVFESKDIAKISHLSSYLLANTLTEISGDPKFLLRFINSADVNLEWRYLGLIDLENKSFKLDKDQRKIIGSFKRKIKRSRIYIISSFKKLREIPKLQEKVKKENLLPS